jgi:hypothetical protein
LDEKEIRGLAHPHRQNSHQREFPVSNP